MKGKDPCDIFLYGFLAFESKSMSDRARGHFDFPFYTGIGVFRWRLKSGDFTTSGGSSNWRGLEVFSRIPQERGGQPKMLLAQCLLFLPSCLLFLARRLPLLLVCCFACSFFLRVRSSVGKESECSLASFGWTSRLPFLLSHASKLPNFLLLCCSYYPRWYAWSQRTRSS